MILRDSLLSKWGCIYIFDHVDDENKLDANRLTTKKLVRLKSLINQENSNSMKEKKINHKSNSQIIYHSYIFY